MSLIHLLAEHPQIQSRIQSEIDEAIGERDAQIKDRNNCPFTEAVVLETLRYISHLPLAVPHCTSEECTISGRAVLRGTTVRYREIFKLNLSVHILYVFTDR
jgi:cytochrome P450 family 2 subfamily U polypeptide 1